MKTIPHLPPMLIWLFLLVTVASCKRAPKHVGVADTNTATLQTLLDSMYAAHPKAIGLMAHVEAPKWNVSWSGAAGYDDLELSRTTDPHQPALIASMTKTYVSATMLRLQELGKLSIEDSAGKYLTTETKGLFSSDGYDLASIKIKHLLSHTSGFADFINEAYMQRMATTPKHRWTRDEQLALAISDGDPLSKPGEAFHYADANYLLCTEIIEQVTHQPFYEAMRRLLKYEALGLHSTWFPTLDEPISPTASLVHQYIVSDSIDAYDLDVSFDLYGGGGIAATTEDAAKFLHALFHHEIVAHQATFQFIHTHVDSLFDGDGYYGLGLSAGKSDGYAHYGHGGFWGTSMTYYPDIDAAITVFILNRDEKPLRRSLPDALARCVRGSSTQRKG